MNKLALALLLSFAPLGAADETLPKADTILEAALREASIPYTIIGDAKEPRRILEAIHEGHRAGREI